MALKLQRSRDILGINRRNLEFIYPHNPRERFPLVDDKVKTKALLRDAGLPIPEAFQVVRWRSEIPSCLAALGRRESFVVKPAQGFGGQGIWVLRRSASEGWERPAQRRVGEQDLAFHMASILSGMYSLDHLNDRVLVEERVEESKALAGLHGGDAVSDLRLLVAETTPAMAMLRLPCRASGGAANLHAGGIGVGIELDSGRTTFAIRDGRPIESHPDTGIPLTGFSLPHWSEVLSLVRRVAPLLGLGYLGVDVALDERSGPLILEVNARPGLAIQLANRAGLLRALAARTGGG